MMTLFDNPWLLVLINGILAATVIHLVPIIFGLALRDRLARFQRTLCRLSLVMAIPAAFTAALAVGNVQPMVEIANLNALEDSPPVLIAENQGVEDAGSATSRDTRTDGDQAGARAAHSSGAESLPGSLADTGAEQTTATASISTWLLGVWLLVAVFLLAREIAGQFALRQEQKFWISVTGYLLDRARLLATRLGYRRRFKVRHGQVSAPAAVGLATPSIVVPEQWCDRPEGRDLDAVLVHEIAHLKGCDPLWRFIGRVTARLLWLCPLSTTLKARDERLSELVADQVVLAQGCDPRRYANLLGRLVKERLLERHSLPNTGILGTRRSMEGRIKMILSTKDGARRRPFIGNLATLLIATLMVIGGLGRPLIGIAGEDRDVTAITVADEDGWHVVRGLGASDGVSRWLIRLAPTSKGSARIQKITDDGCVIVEIGGQLWVIDTRTGKANAPRTQTPDGASVLRRTLGETDSHRSPVAETGTLGELVTEEDPFAVIVGQFDQARSRVERLRALAAKNLVTRGNLAAAEETLLALRAREYADVRAQRLRGREAEAERYHRSLEERVAALERKLNRSSDDSADPRRVHLRQAADPLTVVLEGTVRAWNSIERALEEQRVMRDKLKSENQTLRQIVADLKEQVNQLRQRLESMKKDVRAVPLELKFEK